MKETGKITQSITSESQNTAISVRIPIIPLGVKYEGGFYKNKYDGSGVYTSKDGAVYYCHFNNGVLVKYSSSEGMNDSVVDIMANELDLDKIEH